jgi:hypothetical protein
MAITNKAAIQALIDAYTANITLYITSNNNKEITGAQLKQILDESSVILEDLKDSYFNLLDEPRTALSVSFAALNALDWDVLPTEVKSALDELASRVETIENEPNQTAFETPYTPTTPADWDVTIPTEVRGGLDQLANRLRGFEPLSLTFAVLDSVNGSDTEGEEGNWNRPFKTGAAIVSALPTNSTIFVINGDGQSLGFTSKNMNIVGFGNSINFVALNGTTTLRIYNLNITNETSIIAAGAGGSACNIYLYNCSLININLGLSGGRFYMYNCTITGQAKGISLAKSCLFLATHTQSNPATLNTVEFNSFGFFLDISENVFKNTAIIPVAGYGKIYNNTFETVANNPINWSTITAGGQSADIEIYFNNFKGTAGFVINEIGTGTIVSSARVYANYYEQGALANLTTNQLITLLNANNIKFN